MSVNPYDEAYLRPHRESSLEYASARERRHAETQQVLAAARTPDHVAANTPGDMGFTRTLQVLRCSLLVTSFSGCFALARHCLFFFLLCYV